MGVEILSRKFQIGAQKIILLTPLIFTMATYLIGWRFAFLDYFTIAVSIVLSFMFLYKTGDIKFIKTLEKLQVSKIRNVIPSKDGPWHLVRGKVVAEKTLPNGSVFTEQWVGKKESSSSPSLNPLDFRITVQSSANNYREACDFFIDDGTGRARVETKPWWIDVYATGDRIKDITEKPGDRLIGYTKEELSIKPGDEVLLYGRVFLEKGNLSGKLFNHRYGKEAFISLLNKDDLVSVYKSQIETEKIFGYIAALFVFLFSFLFHTNLLFAIIPLFILYKIIPVVVGNIYIIGFFLFFWATLVYPFNQEAAKVFAFLEFAVILGIFLLLIMIEKIKSIFKKPKEKSKKTGKEKEE